MARRGTTTFGFAAHRVRWAGLAAATAAVERFPFRHGDPIANSRGKDDGGSVSECYGKRAGVLDHVHDGGQ